MRRIFLPPGPIKAPIFSGSILRLNPGACSRSSLRDSGMCSDITAKISSRSAVCPVASTRYKGQTSDFEVWWKPVILPGACRNPYQSDPLPKISVRRTCLVILPSASFSVINPVDIPAHGAVMGPRHPSETATADGGHRSRTIGAHDFRNDANCVGKLIFGGRMGSNERSARAPCPISRRR